MLRKLALWRKEALYTSNWESEELLGFCNNDVFDIDDLYDVN
jgi:hypothetical protein